MIVYVTDTSVCQVLRCYEVFLNPCPLYNLNGQENERVYFTIHGTKQ